MKYLVYAFLFFLIACKDDEETTGPQTFRYDFEEGMEGWTAGFSDYPADWDPDRFQFRFAHADLPDEANGIANSLEISGDNPSDDLFMYIKKQITGLAPDREYLLQVQVELASRYPEDSPGIGGSPGASVYLKAGGSTHEPQTMEEGGMVVMNIDKGNQSQGGNDMVVIGNVGIPGDEFSYTLIQRDNMQQPVRVRTDDSGNLWVIIGTDSGFEGTTTLYYNTVEVFLEE